MTRYELARQRREAAVNYVASIPGLAEDMSALPQSDFESLLGEIEQKVQSQAPEQYATSYKRQRTIALPVAAPVQGGAQTVSEEVSIPVMDMTSEKTLEWIGSMTDEELRELSSGELAALQASLPIAELYPEKAQAMRKIGRDRTGIGDAQNQLLSMVRGATPFGGDIMNLSEDEIAALMLQNPQFENAETAAAVASMFGGATSGFKFIGKLDKVGKWGKIGLNILKEGGIGAAYADAAPGILPTLMDKPDDHILNFIEAAAIASTVDAGFGLVKALRGKTLRQARGVIADSAEAGDFNAQRATRLPDKLTLGKRAPVEDTLDVPEPVAVFPAGKNAAKRFYENQLKRGGGLPDDAFVTKTKFEGKKQANAYMLRKDVDRVRKELRTHFKGGVPEKDLADLNKILHGESVAGADDKIVEIGNRFRKQIEDASVRLRPHVSEELQATFDKNLDTYVHRSYEVHDNPNWPKKIKRDPKLRDAYSRAFAYLKDQNPDIEDIGIHNMLDRIVDPDTYKGGLDDQLMLIGMGRGILKHRKDIPGALREVMGEFQDPFVNYVKTMTKIDNLTQNKRMVSELMEQGKGKWLFESPQSAGQRGVTVKIGGDLDGIKNMYATKDVAKAIRTMGEAGSLPTDGPLSWYRYFLMAKSSSQVAKTILSPSAHLRNFMGSGIMAAANGNFSRAGLTTVAGNIAGGGIGAANIDEDDPLWEAAAKVFGGAVTGGLAGKLAGTHLLGDKRFQKAWSIVANDVMGKGNVDLEKAYARYLEDGVVESSATFKEMKKVLQDSGARGYSPLERLADTKPAKATFDAYRGQDDVWKIYTHMAEREKLIKRGWKPDAAWDRATKIVLNNLPNYGRTGRLVQNLRRLPIGNFVSFPAEIIRNVANITHTAIEEMGTQGLRDIGLKRMASLLGVGMSGAGAAASLSRLMTGVTKQDDLRIGEDSAPWERNATRFYLGKENSTGYPRIQYIDLSYTDPYMYAKEAGVVALNEWQRGGTPEEVAFNVMGRSVQKLLEPFVEPSILTQALAEVGTGVTGDGREIYNRDVDGWGDILEKSMLHIFQKAFEPGGMKDVRDLTNPYKHRPSEMLQLATGLRVQTYDPMESLRYRSGEFAANRQEISSRFSRMAGNKKTKPEGVVQEFQEANRKMFEQQQRIYRTILNSRRAGLGEGHIRRQLKQARLSDRDIGYLITGRFKPYRVTENAHLKMVRNGLKYPRQEVAELWSTYNRKTLDEAWDQNAQEGP